MKKKKTQTTDYTVVWALRGPRRNYETGTDGGGKPALVGAGREGIMIERNQVV